MVSIDSEYDNKRLVTKIRKNQKPISANDMYFEDFALAA